MYKQLIKRKLGYLLQTNTSIINTPSVSPAYQKFDDHKRQEIIVWIRQLKDMDKDQVKDNIKDKFNISDEDAEKFYYEAYPDGLSTEEDAIITCFEELLPQENQQEMVDNVVLYLTEGTPMFDTDSIDQEALSLFLEFMDEALASRKII
jgi:hypothetical protein